MKLRVRKKSLPSPTFTPGQLNRSLGHQVPKLSSSVGLKSLVLPCGLGLLRSQQTSKALFVPVCFSITSGSDKLQGLTVLFRSKQFRSWSWEARLSSLWCAAAAASSKGSSCPRRGRPYLLPQKRYGRMESIPEMFQITACRDLAGGSRAFSFSLEPRYGVHEAGNSGLLHLLPSQCPQPHKGPWGLEVVH